MTAAADIPGALADALQSAAHVCVLTGAGISAESGVPTFRDAQQGLWAEHDPLQLATLEGFLADPALVWRWYRWRRELVASVQPNSGHRALARLDRRVPASTLVTQNVDGLHQRAGSSDVIEFHGNLFVNRCLYENTVVEADDTVPLPTCPDCGSVVRPGVVWFGEAIPEEAASAAFEAASRCDVFLSIGTSSLVYPAAGLVDVARDAGAITVEVNPEPTEHVDRFDYAFAAPAGTLLPKLVDSIAASRD